MISASDLDPGFAQAQQQAPAAPADAQQQQQPFQQQQADAASTPQQPAFDIKEFGFNDTEHFKTELSRLRQLEEEEKSDTSYIRDLRKATRSGIKVEDFNRAQSIDLEKMSAAEKVAFSRKLKNPELSEEDANFLVSKEFGAIEDERYKDVPDNQLPDDIRESRIRLKLEEAEAAKNLQQYKVDALTPPLEKNLRKWGEKLGSTISEASAVEFTIDPKLLGEGAEPVKLSYKSDNPELPKQLRDIVENVLSIPDVEIGPDEEGIDLIKSAVQREIFVKERAKMINHFVSEALRIKKALELKSVINPSAAGMSGAAPVGNESDPDVQLMNSMTRKRT